jgi:hypothetical protein
VVFDRALAESLEVGWCVCWEAGCDELGVPRVVYESFFSVDLGSFLR